MASRWNWVEMLFRIDSNLGVRRLRISSGKSFIAAFFIAFLFFYLEIIELPKNSVISTDELWGATLTTLPFFKSIVFVLQFDVHPPLYYMQLNLWSLAGHSDQWLQLNSLAWLLATATIVWHLVKRHYNSLAALIAAAFTLTSPSLVYYAFEVRMNTFLGFLTVLGLLLSETLFETFVRSGMPSRRQWFTIFLADLAVCYSYATGSIIIIAHFCYGLLSGYQLQLPRRFFLRWIILHVALGLLSLPVVINSMVRQVGHAALPDALEVVSSVTQLFVGLSVDRLGVLTFSSFAILCLTLIGFLVTLPQVSVKPLVRITNFLCRARRSYEKDDLRCQSQRSRGHACDPARHRRHRSATHAAARPFLHSFGGRTHAEEPLCSWR